MEDPALPRSCAGKEASGLGANGPVGRLKVAYLVNQYPAVSHSFIRREIAALEARGVEVVRFSIRRPPGNLVDPADTAEARVTRVLLGAGPVALLGAWLAAFAAAPRRWLGALWAALKAGRRSDRGVGRHLVYMAEACLLLRWMRQQSPEVGHLHAHFGTNPAAVAMLARLLGGPPYSFTVHGPDEFNQPRELSLRDRSRMPRRWWPSANSGEASSIAGRPSPTGERFTSFAAGWTRPSWPPGPRRSPTLGGSSAWEDWRLKRGSS